MLLSSKGVPPGESPKTLLLFPSSENKEEKSLKFYLFPEAKARIFIRIRKSLFGGQPCSDSLMHWNTKRKKN